MIKLGGWLQIGEKKIKAIKWKPSEKKWKISIGIGPIYAYRQTMWGNLIADWHLDHQVSISFLFWFCLLSTHSTSNSFTYLPPKIYPPTLKRDYSKAPHFPKILEAIKSACNSLVLQRFDILSEYLYNSPLGF